MLTACAVAAPTVTPAPPPSHPAATVPRTAAATPLVMGETFALDSSVLGERRVVNVYLPPGYRDGAGRFPVLYLLDGGVREDFPHVTGLVDVSIKNLVIQPMIVVGVENTERRRDLVGPSQIAEDLIIAPHAGGADRFREFLRYELLPQVAARYRTTSASTLIGESFAGLFVVETLLVAPDLFDTYIAVSPSLWWNQQALVRGAPARLAATTVRGRRLFLATADELAMQQSATLLTAALRAVPPTTVSWQYLPLPEEHHNTVFPLATLRALRALFAMPAPRR
jgi:uncharacterized protein